MRYLLIYNPNSGKGKIKRYLNYIEKKVNEFCSTYKILQTSCKEDISKFILGYGEDFDVVVICGGDGTISEAVNAIASLKKKPKLAILPTGTVNDIAHNFNITRNLKKAISLIFEGSSFSCDCIKVNDRYGLYVMGAGIFTETSYTTSQRSKKIWGRLAYAFHGIKKIFKTKNVDLKFNANGQNLTTKTPLFLIINSRYVAGFKINKTNICDDGKVLLAILTTDKDHPRFIDLCRIAKLFLKGTDSVNKKFIIKKDVSSLEIDAEQTINFNLDGELFQAKRLQINIKNKFIDIIVPKNN